MLYKIATQAEAEGGTEPAVREFSPLRIKQAITALGAGGVTDHGALTGLADDDHPQYALDSDLAGKANTSHTHPESDVTGLVSDLAGKAASVHSHAQSEVTNLVTDLAAKQATLVSGTNIKTVNGSTLLGSGNLVVSAADPSYSPGSFTVVTETGRMIINHMKLASTERATIEGTGRLAVAF